GDRQCWSGTADGEHRSLGPGRLAVAPGARLRTEALRGRGTAVTSDTRTRSTQVIVSHIRERSLAMVTFAAITFSNSLIGWIVVGLVAGFLAHTVFGAGSGGLLSDLIVGLIGALVGGF